MRYLLMMLMVIVATQVTASGVYDVIESLAERAQETAAPSDIEVVEIFRAQTSEELEAALTDGYPMPWLEEILSDESIPEEDRYWLDCRVRAVIAQDLHLFYDRNGNPITYEADWIMPGEHYWRETFVIDPIGADIVSLPVELGGNLRVEPGILINSFGQQIGEIAHTARLIGTSRDGSLAASGLLQVANHYRLVLLYSDGSYFVSPIEMGYGRCGVSQSGDYVILAARGKRNLWNREDILPRAILLNRSGEIIWETELEMTPIGNPTPVISPDDRYCAVVTQASSAEDRLNLLLQVFDMETGREVWRVEDPKAAQLSISPNGYFLNVSGSEGITLDMETGQEIWSDRSINKDAFPIADLMHLNCSGACNIISGMVWPSSQLGTQSVLLTLFDRSGNVLIYDNIYGNIDISPNGCIVISENYQSSSDRSAVPVIVRRIINGGE